jgi:hypothetical protein
VSRRIVSWAVALLLLAGCQTATKNAYENDPLVLSKKPVEGAVSTTPPAQVAMTEPMAPAMPVLPDAVANRSVAAQPTAILKAPLLAIPAVRSTAAESLHGPVYGHAADLSWLQGVVEKHFQGYFELRYAEPTINDRWGGKVRLDDDQRLAGLCDGDVVRVEGFVSSIPLAEAKSSWSQPPLYKVEGLRLLQPAH